MREHKNAAIEQKQHKALKYLGTLITQEEKVTLKRIRELSAEAAFQKMRNIFTNKNMSSVQRTFRCYVEFILRYGCDARAVTKPMQKKKENRIEALYMWFWKRLKDTMDRTKTQT